MLSLGLTQVKYWFQIIFGQIDIHRAVTQYLVKPGVYVEKVEDMDIEAGIRLWNVGTVSRGIWIYGAGTP